MTSFHQAAAIAFGLVLAMPSLANAHSVNRHMYPSLGGYPHKSEFGSSFKWKPTGEHHGAFRAFKYSVYPQIFIPQGCGWLKARAIDTGSPYWWDRYYACKGY